jgi:hypothetical protein
MTKKPAATTAPKQKAIAAYAFFRQELQDEVLFGPLAKSVRGRRKQG